MKLRYACRATTVSFCRSGWLAGLLLLLVAAHPAAAQVSVTIGGPSSASLCETVTMTATVRNVGATISDLRVTNVLPSSLYAYVRSNSTVILPGNVILTNTAADPASIVGTRLGWDFSTVVGTARVNHILITEVMYDATNATEDAYEWFELYNPTLNPVGLTNWSVRDVNPGQSDTLPTMVIQPGEFVIVAANTNNFLAMHPSYTGQLFQISDGKIGSGLNNFADGLFLRNELVVNQDAMSYGSSGAAFSPPVPLVSVEGRSLERVPANEDSNTFNDWDEQASPNPGSGSIRSGIGNGEQIVIKFQVEIPCGAVAGQFFSYANYQIPPGTFENVGAAFLTINEGNLTVRKTPILQQQPYGDEFTWTIYVKNEGFGNAPNVEILDTAGSGIQFTGFSVPPTNTPPYGQSVAWDASVFPALALVTNGQEVSVTVTARVVLCENLYNDVDARWGCRDLVAATNSDCEFTALVDETARATIDFLNEPPLLSATISPAAPIAVPYCDGVDVTITVTNPDTAGPARDLVLLPTQVDGFGFSGGAVDTNGNIVIGDIDPGQSTNVVVHLAATNCPVPLGQQYMVFRSQYEDLCGNPFSALGLFTTFEATALPGASIVKQMQDEISGSSTAAVTILMYYTNFASTAVSIIDTYPRDASNLLSVSSISAPGVNDGTNITWALTLSGSGVYTARFSIVAAGGDYCDTPDFFLQNVLTVPDFVDCVGCVRAVSGSGQSYPLSFYPSCPSGGTGGCAVASSKSVSATLAEVCSPVVITQRFALTGALPSNDWQGVRFQSDLAGGWTDSNSVQVLVLGTNGVTSNVTTSVTFSNVAPVLTLAFDGLTNTPFYAPSTVSTMTFVWAVSHSNAGLRTDASWLTLGRCGSRSVRAYWVLGESSMGVYLHPITNNDACGVANFRIDLTNFPGPGVQGYPSKEFPAYDVRLVLDLDADNNAQFTYDYVTNSTLFTNMLAIGGGAVPSAEPSIAGSELTWDLGDLATNGAGSVYLRVRASCTAGAVEKLAARLEYNNRCGDGVVPRAKGASSMTNTVPPLFSADILEDIQPQFSFLYSTQYVTRIEMMNVGAGGAYEVETEMLLPSNIVFGSASVAPVFISATNVRWEFHTTPTGELEDLDGDGSTDDLAPNGRFSLWVTNFVTRCGANTIHVRGSHGCKGERCEITPLEQAEFDTAQGSLVTRVVFPAERYLCSTNRAEYSVRNAGLVDLYDVKATLELPTGVTYAALSSRYIFNNVTNPIIGEPSGSGIPGDPLVWNQANIPELATLSPTQTVTIFFLFPTECAAASGSGQFTAIGEYTDLCGTTNVTSQGIALANVREPVLSVLKEASYDGGTNFTPGRVVLDPGDTIVYRITIDHTVASEADVNSLQLLDRLPTNVTYVSASPAPDTVSGGVGALLTWTTTNLLSALGAPYQLSDPALVVYVTGTVITCLQDVDNLATLDYGCGESDMCLTASDSQQLRTRPSLSVLGSAAALTLNTCGGTKTVTITNNGSTAAASMSLRESAPAGYLFASATISGEFVSTNAGLVLSGSPAGSVATLDLSATNIAFATDASDDAGDGNLLMDLGFGESFTVTFTLVSAGNNLDCSANPRDLDYADPDPGPPTQVTGVSTMLYSSLCGATSTVAASSSLYPDLPDADIDLQPNSYIATNNEVVNFTVTVRNQAERGNAENLHVRVKFGTGWTNLALVSSNIVQSGAGVMQVELQGDTNALIALPGVVLDPLDDYVELVFAVTAEANAGDQNILAEVVASCDDALVVPGCVFTNTLGLPPMADTMSGALIGPVNGQYYSFDQDQSFIAGYSLTKTVRYAAELPAAAGTSRTARVGEDLIYRLEASYFGNVYSNITVVDSLPTNLNFGTPYNYAFSGGITGATWDAVSGIFTIQPTTVTSSPSSFSVDIPVVVSNMAANQDGVVFTNAGDSHFDVDGLTNETVSSLTQIRVLEPDIVITKAVNSNLVQSGDIVIFTNRVTHSGLSTTSAYDLVFVDALPDGLTFSGLDLGADGLDNDGDGATDEGDESLLVIGNTFTVTTNESAPLAELALSNSVVFRFPALVTNQVIGATIVNTSRVTWTSLNGEATNRNERTGSGGVNDYTNQATAAFASKTLGGVTKSFVSSSQTNTLDGATNVFTIGERMIYSIRVDVPQGIATNVTITEIVPPGMDWVGGNTNIGLAYPGFGYFFTVPAGGPRFPTTTVEGLVITDPDPTPTNSLTVDGSGSNIVFRFGAITNTPDGDAGNDYVTLSMEFVILNQATNDGLLPGIYTNRNRAQVQDAYSTYAVTSAVYTIAEHDLTLTKLISPTLLDASNTVTITLIVSNRPQALANAYDIVIDDFLSNRVFDVGTLNVTFLPDGWSYSSNVAAQGMTYSLFTTNTTALVPGTAVTNRFTINIAQGVVPNAVYTNRGFVTASDTIYGDPPGGIPFRSDTTNALRTLQITNFAIAKSLEATSETNNPPDSTNTLVQIGETVTYRVSVTLPEATITNLAIADLVPTNGIAYIRNSARVDTNTFAGVLGTLGETPAGSGLLATNGQAITFTFSGNTFAWGDNDPANNTFHLLLDVLVLDTNFNAGFVSGQQTVHTNRATVTFTGNRLSSVTSGVVTTTLIEPRLGIRKNIVQTDVDAGDVVDIQITVTNSGLATAYDLVITDPLNSFYFDPGSVAHFTGPTGYTYSVVGTNLVIRSDTNAPTGTNTLEIGESLFFTFQVTMAGTLPPNSTVTNWALVSGDTLRGTNIFAVQRTYSTNAFDSVTAGDFALLKTLYATSETGPADSTNGNLQVGEIATWQLETVLPEGTVSNLTFTDFLPTGLQYVAGSLVVDLSAFNGTMAPVTNVTVSAGQVQIVFLGDTVVTADNNPANNVLDVRFDSVLLNTNWITGLPPQTVLTNRATVTYANNPSSPATSGVVVVRAVEPSLAIRKDIDLVSGDAGDTATITLVATNSGLAAAYDLEIADVLAGRVFDIGSVTHVVMPAGFTFSVSTSLPNATVYYRSDTAGSGQATNSLEPGEALTFVFSARLSPSVEPGVAYTNIVSLTADTIDQTNYVGVQRGYTNTAQDAVSISNMFIGKILAGTSEDGPADTVGARVAIGERALYVLYVTLPESTITNLVVNDLLPAGMACVTSSVSVDVTGFGGSLPGAPAISSNVTFLFNGLTVVSNNNDGLDNTFQIVFEAVTRDVPSNDGLPASLDGDEVTTLTNVATVAYDGYPPAATSELRRVDVQEPSLLIQKTMSGPSNGWVNVEFVVTNRGLATAFDVVVTDVFPTNWWNTASITGVAPTGFVFTVTNAPGTGYLTILSDTNYAQPTNSIEAGEALTFRFTGEVLPSARGVITNTVVVDVYTTVDGTNTDERLEPKTNSTALLPLPGYGLRKTLVSPSGRPAAIGETVIFNIVVTNNGGMGLNPVRVDDTFDSLHLSFASAVPSVDGSGAGSLYWTNVGPLAIGGTTTLVVNFTAQASTLPDDTTNRAVGTVFTTNGLPLPPLTGSVPVRIAAPAYVLRKTLLSPTGRPAVVGETVVFQLAVTNSGDIRLDTVRLDDTFVTNDLSFASAAPAPDAQGVGSLTWLNVGPLDVGGYTAVTVRYTAVRSTLPGDTTNRVVSTITTTNGVPVPPQTSSVPAQIAAPAYTLDKVLVIPTNGVTTLGQPVIFRITVTNAGDVMLDTVRIDDTFNATDLSFVGATPAESSVVGNQITWLNVGPLGVGGTAVITSRFTSLRSTVPGNTTNIAVSTVSTTNGLPIPNQTNDATARVVNPGVSLVKLAGNAPDGGVEYTLSGSNVVFTYQVVNTGDTYLVSLVVTDNVLGVVGTITGLAPSAGATLYTTSAVAASVTNLGVVAGDPAETNWIPLGLPPVRDEDDAIVEVVGPAIRLVKTAGSAPDGDILYANRGSDVVYTYQVVNVGNTYLTNVVVTDNVLGVVGTVPVVMAPNQTNFLYATNFSVLANVTNLGVVVGTPSFPDGTPIPDLPTVRDDDDAVVEAVSPGYTLDKVQTSPAIRPAIIGETVTFRVRVVNTGDVTLVTVPLTDTFETNYLAYNTAAPLPDATGIGTLAWTNIGPLVPRTTADVSISFIALKDTLDEPRTNVVTTSPATPTNYPPVPPTTTGALYWVNSPARIGDFVWEDVDADGLQGGGETGVVGVTVRLYDDQTNLIDSTVTDATGFYEFTNLYPWAYFVEFVTPAGYELTFRDVGGDNAVDSDPDPVSGRTALFIVTSGSDNPTWDAGLFRRSSLGDFVWHDLNADGIQDPGETGLVNAVVTLLTPLSTVVGVTTTDVNGAYAFTNLVPGNYVINVSGLTGYFISPQDVGGDDAVDSDVSPLTGDTTPFFLGSAVTNLTLDAGLYLPASLGDVAWEDTNGNGVQDLGEPGLSNVVVWLYDAGDVIVGVATTDVNGAYAFTNLVPGAYYLGFTPPPNYLFTARDQGGDDALDSDPDVTSGYTIATTLISGENDLTWDAGLLRLAAIGDFVWLDLNADGVQDPGESGMTNVTVRLYDADTNLLTSTVTDAAGAYVFTNLLPGTYLVEFVTPAGYNISAADQGGDDDLDSDAGVGGFAPPVTLVSGEYNLSIDAGLFVFAELGNFVWEDMNGDGLQGAGEPGLGGFTVTLYDGVGGLGASTTTDVSGFYLFTNLVPGAYYVNVALPVGYVFTLQDQGADDAADSDMDGVTGNSGNYTLVSGQSDLSVDAGLYRPASIGNRVWEDQDYDAIQDTNELYSSFVTGLVVRLYTSNDILYATTTTDTNGYYLFGDLPPGGYFVEFTAPTSHIFVLSNQGTNDLIDSDADRTNRRTAATFLTSGESDLSWDAGIIGSGIIGDHVWVDVNNNGQHDENLAAWGINGVRVYLYRVSGGVTSYVATTTTITDASGKKGFYEFRGLQFGDYLVVVEQADIPPKLTIKTTVLSYRVRLRPEYAYFDADFGFNGLATPVELRWFKAERGPEGGVLVSWATAVEVDNQGFNILRATAADGARVRVNSGLIAGEGTSAGRTYEWFDASADAGTTYYYWLEDVSFAGVTELHGPAVVRAEGAKERDEALAVFGVEQGMTVYRITHETLAAAGLGALDPARMMVKIGGEPVAIYVMSDEAVMKDGDYILFYAPAGAEEQDLEVVLSTNAPAWQMELVYAAPTGEGDLWYGTAADGRLAFETTPALSQYLLIGFPRRHGKVLDVTDARRPRLLYGYGWMNTAMGVGLYLGYATEVPAQCLAISDASVTDVEHVTRK